MTEDLVSFSQKQHITTSFWFKETCAKAWNKYHFDLYEMRCLKFKWKFSSSLQTNYKLVLV